MSSMLGASKNFQGKRIEKTTITKCQGCSKWILLVPKGRWLCALHVKKKCFCPWVCFQNVNIGMWLLFREMQTIQIDRNQIAGFSANYFSKTSLKVSLFLTFYSAFEYYVSMLIRQFVSLWVACVKSYHTRSKATLHRQREGIQTDGSIC